jgi:signal transduction histidine kinase
VGVNGRERSRSDRTRSRRNALINDILDLSKVEAERMDLELAPVALGELLENGVTMVHERATHQGIEVHLLVEVRPGFRAAVCLSSSQGLSDPEAKDHPMGW